MADLSGLEGLAAIEDFAIERSTTVPGSPRQSGLDWAFVKHRYMSSAYIARFMDESGLTTLMESHLASTE
jgi:hypothetical protein